MGARAVLVLAGFTVFLIYASATMFDTMLALSRRSSESGLLWRIGQGEGGWRIWAGFGMVLGFGVYAKGPVIFVHLMPVLLTMPLWAPAPPRLAEAARGFALALAAGLVLVALWLVPALAAGTAAYREELLWTQSAARVAGGMAHDRPVWFLRGAPAVHPLSLGLVLAGVARRRGRGSGRRAGADAGDLGGVGSGPFLAHLGQAGALPRAGVSGRGPAGGAGARHGRAGRAWWIGGGGPAGRHRHRGASARGGGGARLRRSGGSAAGMGRCALRSSSHRHRCRRLAASADRRPCPHRGRPGRRAACPDRDERALPGL